MVAAPPLQVVLFHGTANTAEQLDELRLPAGVRQQLTRFWIERHALGRLRSADDVGRTTLDARPDLDWIIVAVQRMTLDPTTERMKSTQARYLFNRRDMN